MILLQNYIMASATFTNESQSSLQPNDSASAIPYDSDNDTTLLEGASEARTSHKRRRLNRQRDKAWDYCRTPIQGVEPYSEKDGRRVRRIWYCKYPCCEQYSCLSTGAARGHMKSIHGVNIDSNTPSTVEQKIQQNLKKQFKDYEQKNLDIERNNSLEALQKAAVPAVVKQAILRLIVHHDLPFNTAQWPELHALIYAVNHQATNCMWKSHQTTANMIGKTFEIKRSQLQQRLQQSRSLIHFTTDTWHSPNFKELQAITGHWVDDTGRLCKALLALKEMNNGHAGIEVAPVFEAVFELFSIKGKAGFITADNHGANDTLCTALSEALNDWNPQQRRLRCVGHIINLAAQAFLFAKSQEAVQLAIDEANATGLSIDEELLQKSEDDDTAGWIKQPALQKILQFVTTLRRSDKLYNAFKRAASKVIRAPNQTRWNSHYYTLQDAFEMKSYYTSFIHANPALSDYELSTADWQLVELTITFLEPFQTATKQCEGDYITLDKVQLHMDALDSHLKEQKTMYKDQPDMAGSVLTAWFAFDKYYTALDETGAYSAALLLHPRHRKAYLTSAWQSKWIIAGVGRARDLWLQYKKEPEAINDDKDTSALSHFQRYMAKVEAKQRSKSGSLDEFDRFINAPQEAIDISPLEWWLQPQQQRSYPQLSQLAIDILSCPAMSAESERVFSATRRSVPWTRARLSSQRIEQLECLKHWQRASVVDEEFELISDVEDTAEAEN